MPRVLLLLPATTYRGEAFLEAAHRLKLDVTVASDEAIPQPSQQLKDFLHLPLHDFKDSVRTVVGFSRQHPFDVVIGVDDRTATLAAHIASALGLPHNSAESVEAAHNKHRMRQLLHEQGVPVPRFAVWGLDVNPAALAGTISFPCVVKPLILSASCGVIRANNPEEFVAAFERVGALLRQLGLAPTDEAGRQLLVEEFVPGREVAVEGLLTNGELRVLALFDKPDPLDGPFFEETIYVTPSRLPASLQSEIASCGARAARALGLREGPVHGECRINDRGVWVIELAARSIGGRCSQTLRFAAGLSLEELILRHAFRMELPALDQVGQAAGVMMLPIPDRGIFSGVRGQTAARAVPGIEELEITALPGEPLVPLPEGTRYLGFMIARGDTPEFVEAALREAHRHLDVVISATRAGAPRDEVPGTGRRVVRF
ncbi:MAG: ATP-grasp domain-containing protein [Nitrospiraceae bacterium]